MRILLAVEESAGIQTIRAAHESCHEVIAVLTSSDSTSSTSSQLGATTAGTAEHFGYPVWPAEKVRDPAFAQIVREHRVDMILNVHSLYIIHREVLEAATFGSFNLHPGPLPQYAGMNAPNWAILNGESKHGVTLHWMEPGIDTGPIAFQSTFAVTTQDTGLSVSARCTRLGLNLIHQLLNSNPQDIPRSKQDLSKRRYFGFDIPFEGEPPMHSAELIERYVRACSFYPLTSPWGTPTITHEGTILGLIEVALTDIPSTDTPPGTIEPLDGKTLLATGDYWIELKRVMVESKVVSAADLLLTVE